MPSYATGFARYAADSKYPELWRNLVGAWCPFLGNTGPDLLRDVSGHYNDGTLVGPTWIPGLVLEFDGGNDYINIVGSSFPSLGNVLTIAARVKTTDAGVSSREIFGQSSTNNALHFRLIGGLIDIYEPGVVIARSGDVVSRDEWHQIIYTRSGEGAGTHAIYLDGISQTLGTAVAANFSDTTNDKQIGQEGNGSEYWLGEMEWVYIWNRALADNEIGLLYREPYAMFEYADIPYARVAVAAGISMPLVMQQMDHFDGGTAL